MKYLYDEQEHQNTLRIKEAGRDIATAMLLMTNSMRAMNVRDAMYEAAMDFDGNCISCPQIGVMPVGNCSECAFYFICPANSAVAHLDIWEGGNNPPIRTQTHTQNGVRYPTR